MKCRDRIKNHCWCLNHSIQLTWNHPHCIGNNLATSHSSTTCTCRLWNQALINMSCSQANYFVGQPSNVLSLFSSSQRINSSCHGKSRFSLHSTKHWFFPFKKKLRIRYNSNSFTSIIVVQIFFSFSVRFTPVRIIRNDCSWQFKDDFSWYSIAIHESKIRSSLSAIRYIWK